MKYYILLILMGLNLSAYSQKSIDTLITYIDTINVHGKVVNFKGELVRNALIIYGNDQITKTDENGFFKLFGLKPNNRIIVDSNQGIAYYNNVSSRYLLVSVKPEEIIDLNSDKKEISVSAIKLNEKPKFKQVIINTESKIYDFDGEYGMGNRRSEYPGGIKNLYKFMNKNLIYPKKAIQNHMEGLVTVEFVINEKGVAENFMITKDLGYGCADEVIRVLKIMKRWTPGISNGKPILEIYSINVPFKFID